MRRWSHSEVFPEQILFCLQPSLFMEDCLEQSEKSAIEDPKGNGLFGSVPVGIQTQS